MSVANGSGYNEPYRPQFHFSAPANWINDPNGLVYAHGVYHLFYQYKPEGAEGTLHWGHATSRDLFHWQHQPLAIYPHPVLGVPFSGSAVVDSRNTAGFKQADGDPDVLVAVYTHASVHGQVQSLAYSRDQGASWQEYAQNPVLSNPLNPDYRDPKVIWHDPSQQWVMVLAEGDHVGLYTSPNLRVWTHRQAIGKAEWGGFGLCEMPDFFPLPVEGSTESSESPEIRWVLLVGVGKQAPNGGIGTGYLLGQFDGQTFTPDNPHTLLWYEFGPDHYAGQSWSDTPAGRRINIAWMDNWRYASRLPTSPWLGSMSVPRELRLLHTAAGIRLANRPVPELGHLVQHSYPLADARTTDMQHLTDHLPELCCLDYTLEWEQANPPADIGLLWCSAAGDRVRLSYQPAQGQLRLERASVAALALPPEAVQPVLAQLPTLPEKLSLQVVLDRGSIEVFADGGLASITALLFPAAELRQLSLVVAGGEGALVAGQVGVLARVWA